MVIKNIVFDIGNVLLRWEPLYIVTKNFPDIIDPAPLARKIFESDIWRDLNLGKITEKEAIKLYSTNLAEITIQQLTDLMKTVKNSLVPVTGSLELLKNIHNSRIPLYSITNNVHEIIFFLRKKYDFLKVFRDIIVSAEVSVLKPSRAIYLHLIDKYQLIPGETVFIDDLSQNVEGAKLVGMYGIHFSTAHDCQIKLRRLGINI
jgi:putative hydrolase of the HAD superfamily